METLIRDDQGTVLVAVVGNQVPRYSGWKLADIIDNRQSVVIKLETKYRDIADGNGVSACTKSISNSTLETKYRDIADGNAVGISITSRPDTALETKYRDIADSKQVY